MKSLRRGSASISGHLLGAPAVLLVRHISECGWCISCVKVSSISKMIIIFYFVVLHYAVPILYSIVIL
jgi:hypothetical protein